METKETTTIILTKAEVEQGIFDAIAKKKPDLQGYRGTVVMNDNNSATVTFDVHEPKVYAAEEKQS